MVFRPLKTDTPPDAQVGNFFHWRRLAKGARFPPYPLRQGTFRLEHSERHSAALLDCNYVHAGKTVQVFSAIQSQ
jgi:hypothetical protein